VSTEGLSTPDTMRDHWWWRPGWESGRSFYTWHVTFADQPSMRALAGSYAAALRTLPTLDLVPVPWLHLTMQGVGFAHEVNPADVQAIVSAAQDRCTVLQTFTVAIGPPRVDVETVHMPVHPAEPLAEVRAAIRAAIGDVWGQDQVPEVAEGWRPHVSLAYSNFAGSAESAVRVIADQAPQTAEITVSSVSLIDLNRDNNAYEWTDVCNGQSRRRVISNVTAATRSG